MHRQVKNITFYKTNISRSFRAILILFFISIISTSVYSQADLIQQIDYNRDSRSVVFALNTNGLGTGFRFSKRKDGYSSKLIDIDLVWYIHSKEKRIPSISPSNNQSKFVYGKLNQLLIARLAFGREKELYSKYSETGIAIRYYYTAGLSLGMLKPVYYEVWKDAEGDAYVSTEKFDADEIYNSGQIYGSASFFKGFGEIDPVFGAFSKLAFSFDINKKYKMINALEMGVILDVYYKPLPIMEYSTPQQYVFTMFIAYRFGKKRLGLLVPNRK